MSKKYDPFQHMVSKIKDAAAEDVDNRLSLGQLHSLVTDELGGEPLVIAAAILETIRDTRSKFSVGPQAMFDLSLKLHDRLYAPPDFRTRKKGAEEFQFELDFGWKQPTLLEADNGGERE